MGKVANNPCHLGGSPPLQSGGQNHKWPTSGQGGYITPATQGGPQRFRVGGEIRSGPQGDRVATSPVPPRGSPTAAQWGAKSEVAHKWQGGYITPATWGVPHRFRVGGHNQK